MRALVIVRRNRLGKYELRRFVNTRCTNLGRNTDRADYRRLPLVNYSDKSLDLPQFDSYDEADQYRDTVTRGTLFLEIRH